MQSTSWIQPAETKSGVWSRWGSWRGGGVCHSLIAPIGDVAAAEKKHQCGQQPWAVVPLTVATAFLPSSLPLSFALGHEVQLHLPLGDERWEMQWKGAKSPYAWQLLHLTTMCLAVLTPPPPRQHLLGGKEGVRGWRGDQDCWAGCWEQTGWHGGEEISSPCSKPCLC